MEFCVCDQGPVVGSLLTADCFKAWVLWIDLGLRLGTTNMGFLVTYHLYGRIAALDGRSLGTLISRLAGNDLG